MFFFQFVYPYFIFTVAQPVLEYFDRVYVSGQVRYNDLPNGQRLRVVVNDPQFPRDSWNVNAETRAINGHRTNNLCESFNNR